MVNKWSFVYFYGFILILFSVLMVIDWWGGFLMMRNLIDVWVFGVGLWVFGVGLFGWYMILGLL